MNYHQNVCMKFEYSQMLKSINKLKYGNQLIVESLLCLSFKQ